MMQPLMYCTVSETPSSPSPPIGPVPTSAQPKEEGASSTGEEPPSVYWMALVLCVCLCLCLHVFASVCACRFVHGVPYYVLLTGESKFEPFLSEMQSTRESLCEDRQDDEEPSEGTSR